MTEPTPDLAAIVQSRADGPTDGSVFVRDFSFAQSVSEDSSMHEPNKEETKREALRRGLVPDGDVTFTIEQRDYPVATVVTYSVPVHPSDAAVSVSTSPAEPPAFFPEEPVQPEPEPAPAESPVDGQEPAPGPVA
ncbi:hypothetical protein [Amycolatopsis sp. NBC_01480]|uniref:hypothetical protein n=1 Tax=Amycolatopsis sp. NBC_01480 TaxID=2903562 RepID=UPI002E2AC28D|nr:hypothetical protein [Amycolatopsis sp. NBC_01480]